MTPERWERIKELFEAALERPPAERAEFLARACEGEAALHAEVKRLLDHHDDERFMKKQPWLPPTEADSLRPSRSFQPDEIVCQRYRIRRFVGRGGMGEVYEAEDLELGGPVALKTIRPSMAADEHMVARFKKEIHLARRVAHRNVCRTFDLARHESGDARGAITFLTMEFLPGETISHRIKNHGPFSSPEAVPIIRQMAEALDAAHRAGVIHRDFKSGNVMLVPGKDGLRPVVTDFGLARGMNPEDYDVGTQGNVAGTPGYMAPELSAGGAATVASDIYALGVVMYEMLTRRRPVQPNARPPEVESALQRAVMRCLERDPANRFSSAGALIAALEDRAPLPEPEPPSRLWYVVAACLAAISLFVWLGWRSWKQPSGAITPEAMSWYQKGTEAIHAGSYFSATKALERALQVDPHFSLAHARMAEAWAELDAIEKAEHEMVLAKNPEGNRATVSAIDRPHVEAILLIVAREFPKAISRYQGMLASAKGSDKQELLLDLGRAYEKDDKFDKAMEDYDRAAKGPPRSAPALLRMAVLLSQRQDKSKEQARAAFDEAEALYGAASNAEGSAEVLYQRGLAANKGGDLQQARAFFEKTLERSRTENNVYQLIRAQLQLASTAVQEGDMPGAEKYAGDSITLAKANGAGILAARGMLSLGNAYSLKGNLTGAEKSYQEALQLARNNRWRRVEAGALMLLADAHVQLKRPEEGDREARQSLEFFEPHRFARETGQCLTIVVRAKRDLGDYPGALAAANRQLELADSTGNLSQKALAQDTVGGLLLELQRYPDALVHMKQNLQFRTALNQKLYIRYASFHCANALWPIGKYEEAKKMLEEATSASNVKSLQFLIRKTLADLALSERRFPDAIRLCQRELAREDNASSAITCELKRILGLAQIGVGRRQEGWANCEEALTIARQAHDRPLLNAVRLAGAEARFFNGDLRGSLALCGEGQADLKSFPETRWRALVIAARASYGLGDGAKAEDLSRQAERELGELSKVWGSDVFASYIRRPDIQEIRRHLLQLNNAM